MFYAHVKFGASNCCNSSALSRFVQIDTVLQFYFVNFVIAIIKNFINLVALLINIHLQHWSNLFCIFSSKVLSLK